MKKEFTILSILILLTLPTIIAPGISEEQISSVEKIELKLIEENKIEWKTYGYSSQGFKIVWSKDENPTYPTREGDKYNYYTEPEKNTDTLNAFDGNGVYYARVCEYLGGKCGIYSNQIEIQLIEKEKTTYTFNDLETKVIKNEKIVEENNCDGCLIENDCYPIGYRVNKTFCPGVNKVFIEQLPGERQCENNFECESNVCVSGECVSEGLIRKVINWLKNFFS